MMNDSSPVGAPWIDLFSGQSDGVCRRARRIRVIRDTQKIFENALFVQFVIDQIIELIGVALYRWCVSIRACGFFVIKLSSGVPRELRWVKPASYSIDRP